MSAFDSLEIAASLKAVLFASSTSSKLIEERKAVALSDASGMARGRRCGDAKINSLRDPLMGGGECEHLSMFAGWRECARKISFFAGGLLERIQWV